MNKNKEYIAELEKHRWPNGPSCPKCNSVGDSIERAGNKPKTFLCHVCAKHMDIKEAKFSCTGDTGLKGISIDWEMLYCIVKSQELVPEIEKVHFSRHWDIPPISLSVLDRVIPRLTKRDKEFLYHIFEVTGKFPLRTYYVIGHLEPPEQYSRKAKQEGLSQFMEIKKIQTALSDAKDSDRKKMEVSIESHYNKMMDAKRDRLMEHRRKLQFLNAKEAEIEELTFQRLEECLQEMDDESLSKLTTKNNKEKDRIAFLNETFY